MFEHLDKHSWKTPLQRLIVFNEQIKERFAPDVFCNILYEESQDTKLSEKKLLQ
jgi:hypothetical protein